MDSELCVVLFCFEQNSQERQATAELLLRDSRRCQGLDPVEQFARGGAFLEFVFLADEIEAGDDLRDETMLQVWKMDLGDPLHHRRVGKLNVVK